MRKNGFFVRARYNVKVLQLISSLGYGGAERLLVDLAPQLRLRGVDICIISVNASAPLAKELEDHGISPRSLSHTGTVYSLQGWARSWWRLRRLLGVINPNIVHSHLYFPDLLSRITAPGSCRLVTTLHSRDPWWYQPGRIRSVGKTWLDCVSGRIRDVRYISVSGDVGNAAERFLGVRREHNRVIENGINIERIVPKSRYARTPRHIVQVGRFYREKNHLMALRAFERIMERNGQARLTFIGDGPLRENIEQEAARRGLGHAVCFLGARDDVPEQLRKADVFWLTSFYEGFPIACIEAMACGLPVVTTSVGGLAELVHGQESGFLVDSDDHEQLAKTTLSLFSDPETAERVGRSARRRVLDLYSIERMADRYVETYRQILSGEW